MIEYHYADDLWLFSLRQEITKCNLVSFLLVRLCINTKFMFIYKLTLNEYWV